MKKFTFMLLTMIGIIFSFVLTGCSDRDAENKPASPETTQQASETATPALIKSDEGSVDAQMDHDNPEPGQMVRLTRMKNRKVWRMNTGSTPACRV